jgi:hypothetical protein
MFHHKKLYQSSYIQVAATVHALCCTVPPLQYCSRWSSSSILHAYDDIVYVSILFTMLIIIRTITPASILFMILFTVHTIYCFAIINYFCCRSRQIPYSVFKWPQLVGHIHFLKKYTLTKGGLGDIPTCVP